MSDTAYVYTIVVDGVVRYIGKGRGDRVRDHLFRARRINKLRDSGQRVVARHFYNKLALAVRVGADIVCSVAVSGLSDEAAYSMERQMIRDAPKGQLWNMRDGGDGGAPTDSVKAKIAAGVASSWKDPAVFKAHMDAITPELRAAQSVSSMRAWADPVKRAARLDAMRKAQQRPELKAKKSAAMRRRWADPETKARISRNIAEAQASPEARARMSESLKRAYASGRKKPAGVAA